MKIVAFACLPFLLSVGLAHAGEASGNGALVLAALVALHSPHLNASEKALLAKYLESESQAPFPAGEKFVVKVEDAICRIGDVDITARSCELNFGSKKVELKGLEAQALYATLVEIGVPSDGAAGTIYESVKTLDCAINPDEVREGGGGGAKCRFSRGP
ncbi:MAG TPA: hypothetical protein VEH76_08025 [Methylocystis sp.]|nr:hypothetical protein [Methylocystis sp.]